MDAGSIIVVCCIGLCVLAFVVASAYHHFHPETAEDRFEREMDQSLIRYKVARARSGRGGVGALAAAVEGARARQLDVELALRRPEEAHVR